MVATSLESICTVKMNMQTCKENCYDKIYTREETKEAKKATVSFNCNLKPVIKQDWMNTYIIKEFLMLYIANEVIH